MQGTCVHLQELIVGPTQRVYVGFGCAPALQNDLWHHPAATNVSAAGAGCSHALAHPALARKLWLCSISMAISVMTTIQASLCRLQHLYTVASEPTRQKSPS